VSIEPNPFHWSPNMKALSALLSLLVMLGGSAKYLGGEIYYFAEAQTLMSQRVLALQGQMNDAKIAIGDENVQRDKSLTLLKTELSPRIDNLEKVVQSTQMEAAAAKQQIIDMKDDLSRIEVLSQENLKVTNEHTSTINETRDDIRATKNAVLPPGLKH
jgi:regulator of replication initiation timing